MSHLCKRCGQICVPIATKLSDWEISEIKARAANIMATHSPQRGGNVRGKDHDGRSVRLKALAAEYDINVRTLYRYLRRAA